MCGNTINIGAFVQLNGIALFLTGILDECINTSVGRLFAEDARLQDNVEAVVTNQSILVSYLGCEWCRPL